MITEALIQNVGKSFLISIWYNREPSFHHEKCSRLHGVVLGLGNIRWKTVTVIMPIVEFRAQYTATSMYTYQHGNLEIRDVFINFQMAKGGKGWCFTASLL